jgi:hypothetical protein
MNYKILNIKDMNQLNGLYQLAFDDILPINFFEWKYFANPFGEAVVLGMYIEDELVGSGALIPEKIKFNSITRFCRDVKYKYVFISKIYYF